MDAKINLEKIKSTKSIKELLEFGIINFDKPTTLDPAHSSLASSSQSRSDCTSFDVVDFVRKKLKLRKTSHFGTLDPMVTGVLPVALNRAVKLSGFFIGEDKEYEGVMRIHEDVSLEEIKKVIEEKFMGTIIQLPPVRSKVKRQEREREIKKFELLKKDGKEVYFRVECQGGTYIRKLIHDLGEEMKIGAHMTGLKRIRAGIFKSKEMVSKEKFEKAVEEYEKGNDKLIREIIIPAEIISEVYPVVEIKEEPVERIMHGQPVYEKDLENKVKAEKNQIVCGFSNSRFVGMFKVLNEVNVFAKGMFVMQEIRN
ncbi:putative tRNA pseudouridine synthase B [uncultured archaeon]|nr:putative tRNA pseudouridine synthase B [uncultured archaeon]